MRDAIGRAAAAGDEVCLSGEMLEDKALKDFEFLREKKALAR